MGQGEAPGTGKRGQAAAETIITYAMMIAVVVAVVLMAISMYGSSPTTPTASSCIFPADVNCRASAVNTSGRFLLDFAQDTGKTIAVTHVRCTQEADATLGDADALPSPVVIAAGTHALVTEGGKYCYANRTGTVLEAEGELGEVYTGKVYVQYIELDTGVPHVVVGEVVLRFEEGPLAPTPTPTPVPTPTPSIVCPYVISVQGSYALDADIAAPGSCIRIEVSNVNLDCRGHSITGGGTGYGIETDASNIRLDNCVVSGFWTGLYLNDSPNIRITNFTASGNAGYGAHVQESNNNAITGGNFSNNGLHGFFLDDSDNNALSGCTVSGNGGDGIHSEGGSNHQFSGNRVTGNGGDGISVSGGVNNGVSWNNASGNLGDGIVVDGLTNCNVNGNNASLNGLNGLHMVSTVNCGFSSNRAYSNSLNGILSEGGVNGNIGGNTACYNGAAHFDVRCTTPMSGSGNTCGTKSCSGVTCSSGCP